ncbi:hypothetical protein [Streptomyces sp. NPDC059371]|uniref:hypothetical protein n=1 Tax=Streptomyces sp. NPDC059371 TaxID=3346812 RepID=UPI0036A44C91
MLSGMTTGVLWIEGDQIAPVVTVPDVDEVFPVSNVERAEIASLRVMAARLGRQPGASFDLATSLPRYLAGDICMSDELVKTFVRSWLAANVRARQAFADQVKELEGSGHRIVDGGQVGSYDDEGRCSWEVTDWRTGEVLASGHTTMEEQDKTTDALDPGNVWYHRDNMHAFDLVEVDLPEGLPESLHEPLMEWLENRAEAEEIAAWLGEPAEEIEHKMSGLGSVKG